MRAAFWDRDHRPRPETDCPYWRVSNSHHGYSFEACKTVHAQPKVEEFVLIRCLMASLNHFAN